MLLPGHYRVLSRVVHLRNLKEQLESQRSLTFDSPRTEIELINEIHILADTVYLEVNIQYFPTALTSFTIGTDRREDGDTAFLKFIIII